MKTSSVPDVKSTVPTARGSGKGRDGKWRSNKSSSTPENEKFEGSIEGMKGHIFDLVGEGRQARLYEVTLQKLMTHIGNTLVDGGRIAKFIHNNLQEEELPFPPAPTIEQGDDPAVAIRNRRAEREYEEEKKEVRGDRKQQRINLSKLYFIVEAQCSERLLSKVKAHANYAAIQTAEDGLGLLTIVRSLMQNVDENQYPPHIGHTARMLLMNLKQIKGQSARDYFEEFTTLQRLVTSVGAVMRPGTATVNYMRMVMTSGLGGRVTDEQIQAAALDCDLAIMFLNGAEDKYASMLDDLGNAFNAGRDEYPKTPLAALTMMENRHFRAERPRGGTDGLVCAHHGQDGGEVEDGAALATDGKQGKKDKSHIRCHDCGNFGHYKGNKSCPNPKPKGGGTNAGDSGAPAVTPQPTPPNMGGAGATGRALTTVGIQLASEANGTVIDKNHVLLDTQANVDIFMNPELLDNIRVVDRTLTIHTTSGKATTNQVGDLNGYGPVWFHPSGIANILSFSRAGSRFEIEYNRADDTFELYKPDGTIRAFSQSEAGLYVSDMSPGTVLVSTVADNGSKYSVEHYSRAEKARKLQKIMGRPSTRDMTRLLEQKLLPNCDLTKADLQAAEHIFGPDRGSLKGKTVRRSPISAREELASPLPVETMARYRNVTVCADIMFVNKIPFLVTISRHIKFGTVTRLSNQQARTIEAAIKQAVQPYGISGFQVEEISVDREFEHLRGSLAAVGIALNTSSRDEHVGEIERYIRTIKERTRAIVNELPFQRLPERLIVEAVYASVFWLNSFPGSSRISDTLSPREIVLRRGLDYRKHCRVEFGSYVQTHEEHDNSMLSRTTGAIALRPTGNAQGGHFFFSLSSGRVLSRNHWTELPMPAEVIQRVHDMAGRSGGELEFYDRLRSLITGTNELEDYELENDGYGDMAGVDDDDETVHTEPEEPAGVADAEQGEEAPAVYDGLDEYGLDEMAGVAEDNLPDVAGVDDDDVEADEDLEQFDVENAAPPPYNLRQRGPPNYEHRYPADSFVATAMGSQSPTGERTGHRGNPANAHVSPPIHAKGLKFKQDLAPPRAHKADSAPQIVATTHGSDTIDGVNTTEQEPAPPHHDGPLDEDSLSDLQDEATIGFVLTQVSMKRGLAMFGEKARDAVGTELQQLYDRDVLVPVMADTLTSKEKRDALEYLMMIKEKRCGKIKARGCADGRKQRVYTSKEEASSPTVAVESIMLSSVIDAKEGRYVATADIPGAFMQADMDEVVHMRLEGVMVDLLLGIAPHYAPFVTESNGKKVLYVRLAKALYGTIRAALLFWRKLTGELTKWGFKINPYDPCVANKDINGKQCTVLWHVDDLKVSHVQKSIVMAVLEQINRVFGKEAPLTVNHGKTHDYLGMKLDYSTDGKVKITMFDYIDNTLKELPATMDGLAATPAANHLFEVNPHAEQLDKKTAEFFHHNVAKLLFLCKRARPDIQTAVAFLTTRVKGPDVDDYKKLKRVMQYLRATDKLPLTLEADDTRVVKWWVDASFAVHPDMKGHTGGYMTLGKGTTYGTSSRQKVNGRSSTEAEIIGLYDVLPQVIWTRNFLEEQGYGVQGTVVHQDNKSTILLAENGRTSSSKRTRHLNIRYFFITDRIKAGDLSVAYCPTGDMVADYFTKPLQGAQFRKMRNLVMNVDPAAEGRWDHRSVLDQEDRS